MEDLQIAETIRQQLYALDTQEVWCWGANNWIGIQDDGESCLGGLLFDIQNCTQLKNGTVKIMLNTKDLYDITIYNETQTEFAKVQDIYCDSLTTVIHDIIDC